MRFVLGDVEVIRIVQWQGAFAPTGAVFPDLPAQTWQDNADWLVPDHWDPGTGMANATIQAWVLRSAGRTILVDPGTGDGRERPGQPIFHRQEFGLVGKLAEAGVPASDVDIVVNTHLHADHAGGNTVAAGGTGGTGGDWAPAFPNARYLIPAADDSYFGPANAYADGAFRLLYTDSVAPVHAEGQATTWDESYRIDENLVLEPAPGHTPGSSVLRLASGADRAVFIGDLAHSPAQILEPCCSSRMCVDPRQAAESRLRILGRAADERELVIPAHFGSTGAVEVRREGDRFTIARWAGEPPAPRSSVQDTR